MEMPTTPTLWKIILKEEKYASHVGMVYQQKDSLNINGLGQVTNGYEFKETVSSYGN
jgi:hypothetical protein